MYVTPFTLTIPAWDGNGGCESGKSPEITFPDTLSCFRCCLATDPVIASYPRILYTRSLNGLVLYAPEKLMHRKYELATPWIVLTGKALPLRRRRIHGKEDESFHERRF